MEEIGGGGPASTTFEASRPSPSRPSWGGGGIRGPWKSTGQGDQPPAETGGRSWLGVLARMYGYMHCTHTDVMRQGFHDPGRGGMRADPCAPLTAPPGPAGVGSMAGYLGSALDGERLRRRLCHPLLASPPLRPPAGTGKVSATCTVMTLERRGVPSRPPLHIKRVSLRSPWRNVNNLSPWP